MKDLLKFANETLYKETKKNTWVFLDRGYGMIEDYLKKLQNEKDFNFKEYPFEHDYLYERMKSVKRAFHLLFMWPIRAMPLYINSKDTYKYIARWRLKIGK